MQNIPPGGFVPPAPRAAQPDDPAAGYSDVIVVPIKSTAASVLLWGADARLCGYVISENTGAAGARAILHDGSDATGEICGGAAVIANGSLAVYFDWRGVPLRQGLYLEVTSGTVVGAAYIRITG